MTVTIQIVLTLIYLLILTLSPRGEWVTRNKLRFAKQEKEIEAIKTDAQHNENDLIARKFPSLAEKSGVEDLKSFRSRVESSINYAIGRHDWYETQRGLFFRMTLWMVSVGLVVVGIITQSEGLSSDVALVIVGGFSIILFVQTAMAVWLYNSELDADRLYRSVSDVRLWFFRYNLPKHSDENTKPEDVLIDRQRFFSRVLECATGTRSLREDLEQLFILQVLQRYKSESLSKLRWAISWSTIFLILQMVFSLIVIHT